MSFIFNMHSESNTLYYSARRVVNSFTMAFRMMIFTSGNVYKKVHLYRPVSWILTYTCKDIMTVFSMKTS